MATPEEEYAATFNQVNGPSQKDDVTPPDTEAAKLATAGETPPGDGTQGATIPPTEKTGEGAAGEDAGAAEAPPEGDVASGASAATTNQADAAVASAAEPANATDVQKEIQRVKSWEGRVKARDKELADREAAIAAREKASAAAAVATTTAKVDAAAEDPALAAAAKAAASDIEAGRASTAEALKKLSDDFGSEFTDTIKKLVVQLASEEMVKMKKVVDDTVEPVKKTAQAAADTVSEDAKQRHFDKISATHADWQKQVSTPEWREFMESASPEDQDTAKAGNAASVVKLISKFKTAQNVAAAAKAAPDPELARKAAAAEGVRSSGLRLPTEPAKSDDFEGAFGEALAADAKK